MLEERAQLLALAERQPLQALHASAGRVSRMHRPDLDFAAVYVPNPTSGEYVVLLNEAVPSPNQRAALRAIVRHHAEAHNPGRIHVFYCNRPRSCEDCVKGQPFRDPDDYHRRTMRRLYWG
jgi:hypothetical protein